MSKPGFGYIFDENGDKQVIPEQLEALKRAENYIYEGASMQKVRDWLVTKTGRNITTMGLLKAIKYDKNKRKTEKNTPHYRRSS